MITLFLYNNLLYSSIKYPLHAPGLQISRNEPINGTILSRHLVSRAAPARFSTIKFEVTYEKYCFPPGRRSGRFNRYFLVQGLPGGISITNSFRAGARPLLPIPNSCPAFYRKLMMSTVRIGVIVLAVVLRESTARINRQVAWNPTRWCFLRCVRNSFLPSCSIIWMNWSYKGS